MGFERKKSPVIFNWFFPKLSFTVVITGRVIAETTNVYTANAKRLVTTIKDSNSLFFLIYVKHNFPFFQQEVVFPTTIVFKSLSFLKTFPIYKQKSSFFKQGLLATIKDADIPFRKAGSPFRRETV